MWRFGIAALLVVLVALVADLVGTGPWSARALRWVLPSSWSSALTGADSGDIGSRSPATNGPSSVPVLTEPRAGSSGNTVPLGRISGPSKDDARIDEASPAYPHAPGDGTVPVPSARPSDDRALSQAGSDGSQGDDGVQTAPGSSDEATARQIAEVQSQLAALGYDPGPPDGRLGRRTEEAVRTFEQDARMLPSGRVDDRLLARLEEEARSRAPLSQEAPGVIATPAPPNPAKREERDFFGSILGGFQRLLGRDFDSVRRPGELTAYCRANASTWIYDFGREAFVYCGNVIAGQFSDQAVSASTAR